MSKHSGAINNARTPFGYKLNENSEREEIPEQIEALNKAYWYYKNGCGLKASRDWLVLKTSRDISIPGLLKAFKHASFGSLLRAHDK